MKVGIIQSSYIPWKGYFDIIHDVELFIFYDDVQFTYRDWRNRNYLKLDSGSRKLLTAPVKKASRGTLICEMNLAGTSWQKEHLNAFHRNYSRGPYFNEIWPMVEDFYVKHQWKTLSDMNQYMTKQIANYLGIKTRFMDARELKADGFKAEKIICLLKKVNASEYISGPLASSYLTQEEFDKHNLKLTFKDYSYYKPYQQLSEPYDHYVTILDLLFNCGPRSSDYIWDSN